MQEVGGDGHYTSDSAGAEQCEDAWSQVVEEFLHDTHQATADMHVLADVVREAREIGQRDEERRERLGLNDEKDLSGIWPTTT